MEKRDINLSKSIWKYISTLNLIEGNKKHGNINMENFYNNLEAMGTKIIDNLRKKHPDNTIVNMSFEMRFHEFYRKEELLTKALNVLHAWDGGDVYTLQKNVVRSSSSNWECGQSMEEFKYAVNWLLDNIKKYKEQEEHDKFNIIFKIDVGNGENVEIIEKSYVEINF